MNLVIGATGMLGSEICRLLRKENKAVRAMVRKTADPIKINRLKELHIEVVYGDLRQPATFKPALKDVNAIITSASSMPFSYAAGTNHPELVDHRRAGTDPADRGGGLDGVAVIVAAGEWPQGRSRKRVGKRLAADTWSLGPNVTRGSICLDVCGLLG